MAAKKRPIVFAEDEQDDWWLTRRAIRIAGIENPVIFKEDGEALLDYLYQNDRVGKEDCENPALVMLDIALPYLDGFGVLEELRADDRFRSLPVIMYTNSREEFLIMKAYRLGATSFVSKSASFEHYVNAIKLIKAYWLDLVRLPEGPSNRDASRVA